jgi:hypothetical protein
MTAGTQPEAARADGVDVFLVSFVCGWVGSLLAQLGTASLMEWDSAPRRRAPQSPLMSRAERRARQRGKRGR